MVEIKLPLKRLLLFLIIFLTGLSLGYFWGKTKEEKTFKKGNQTKALPKISLSLKSLDLEEEYPEVSHHQKQKKEFNITNKENLLRKKASSKEWKSTSKKININTASSKELTKLHRIGEKIAQNIIDYRKKNGPFKDTKDLLKVKRIGPKILANIQEMVTVEDN
ncbi:helix-hairpin-helix domain-containing protein [bacterium]|nr:helix-hairpin-helix domain-containing protein [bacterium]MBU0899599.1 helix-hairpin-helix domain-containing protein [bacterium]MBU1153549.1 helix-hairpin-helix domain-containing protein [bacterium]MBU1782620.1 helix-hairpin-helix domain-containing protein [bacterium]